MFIDVLIRCWQCNQCNQCKWCRDFFLLHCYIIGPFKLVAIGNSREKKHTNELNCLPKRLKWLFNLFFLLPLFHFAFHLFMKKRPIKRLLERKKERSTNLTFKWWNLISFLLFERWIQICFQQRDTITGSKYFICPSFGWENTVAESQPILIELTSFCCVKKNKSLRASNGFIWHLLPEMNGVIS